MNDVETLEKPHIQHNNHALSSTITYDVKPLVKIALSHKRAKAFCMKTNTLAKHRNSRYKYVKSQLKEEIDAIGVPTFVDKLLECKAYLHPAALKALGKYLKCNEVAFSLRKKVG